MVGDNDGAVVEVGAVEIEVVAVQGIDGGRRVYKGCPNARVHPPRKVPKCLWWIMPVAVLWCKGPSRGPGTRGERVAFVDDVWNVHLECYRLVR